MTLTDALNHPWLASCHPDPTPSQIPREEISAAATIMRDVSMREPLSDSMSMNLDSPPPSAPQPMPGAFPGGSQYDRPIQRRRKVIDEAREKGEAVEPTAEMIEHARLEQQRADAHFFSHTSRPRKRKADDHPESPLQPMEEEEGEDEAMGGMSAPRVTRAARRGRDAEEAQETPMRAQRGRGRGRGGKTNRPVVDDPQEIADGSPRVRRSTRLQSPAKPGRSR